MTEDIKPMEVFSPNQIGLVNESVVMAEDLVSNYYKMSASQWLGLKYDIKTLDNLCKNEIIQGPFAHVLRYEGRHENSHLISSVYDFYKICIQDHTILSKMRQSPEIKLFPFLLYIITHELIHIVRFRKFLQNFHASSRERMAEEARVHEKTYRVLGGARVSGLNDVFRLYDRWRLGLIIDD